METLAVVMQQPGTVTLDRLGLSPLSTGEVAVDVRWSGISTGTERLLWSGTMPAFPGMGYPLVPGYETVGVISHAASGIEHRIGELVFVSGARCYGDIRGLFGGAASRLICDASKATRIPERLNASGVLMALAATAQHALTASANQIPPELIIGHGVLGRLLARLTVASGHPPPTVWELNEDRHENDGSYTVVRPDQDSRRDYRCICDVSGDSRVLDELIARCTSGAELVLAGFYADRVSFDFPPAFMRELRISIAAEWQPQDLQAVVAMVEADTLSLDGLITHQRDANDAAAAYEQAFNDASCLKMILDWRHAQ